MHFKIHMCMRRNHRRKINIFRSVGSLFLAAIVLFCATGAFATIVGTAHDFSNGNNPHAVGQICEACHVPHNAKSNQVPLWRGTLSFFSPTYNLYSSNTLDASVNQPTGPTKACLSCHDGTIGRGPLQGSCFDCHAYSLFEGGLNLGQHHPVSFRYDSLLAQQDGQLHDPSSTAVSSLGGKTIRQGMLHQDRMECPSCHDIHATKGDSATTPKLLLVANNGSRLCLTCHNK